MRLLVLLGLLYFFIGGDISADDLSEVKERVQEWLVEHRFMDEQGNLIFDGEEVPLPNTQQEERDVFDEFDEPLEL